MRNRLWAFKERWRIRFRSFKYRPWLTCSNACDWAWPYGFVPEDGCSIHDPSMSNAAYGHDGEAICVGDFVAFYDRMDALDYRGATRPARAVHGVTIASATTRHSVKGISVPTWDSGSALRLTKEGFTKWIRRHRGMEFVNPIEEMQQDA